MFTKVKRFNKTFKKRASKSSYWVIVATRIIIGVAIAVVTRYILN
ncbi:hypothetical protein [Paenibacillus sp. IHB B 3415]|nr:hypothetical protein [Paenibacillus sp. IHB B 3415]